MQEPVTAPAVGSWETANGNIIGRMALRDDFSTTCVYNCEEGIPPEAENRPSRVRLCRDKCIADSRNTYGRNEILLSFSFTIHISSQGYILNVYGGQELQSAAHVYQNPYAVRNRAIACVDPFLRNLESE